MENVLATYKQVEHALRHLDAIAEHTNEGVAVLDPAGVVQFVNPAWAMMHGYQTTNELVGRPIGVFLSESARSGTPPLDGAGGEQKKSDATAFIEQARQRGQKIVLVEHLKSDGTSFLAQMKMAVVKDEAGGVTGFVVFATDVTQRRRLEEILRGNARRAVQFAERIAQLQKLFVEARVVQESLAKQAMELDTDSQELQQQIAQWAQQPHETRTGHIQPLQRVTPEDSRHKTDDRPATSDPESGGQVPQTESRGRARAESRRYPLDTEELRKVAELGRRLASLSQ